MDGLKEQSTRPIRTRGKDEVQITETPSSLEIHEEMEWPDYELTQQTPQVVWFPSKEIDTIKQKVSFKMQLDEEHKRSESFSYPPVWALAIDYHESSNIPNADGDNMVAPRRLCLFKSIGLPSDVLSCDRMIDEQQVTPHHSYPPAIEAKAIAKPRPIRIKHQDCRDL